MSREKQIEEMAKIIANANGNEQYAAYHIPDATDLYNAGYRKASEVAEEIFGEIDKLLRQHRIEFDMSCVDFYFEKHYAELKKKYTEEGK